MEPRKLESFGCRRCRSHGRQSLPLLSPVYPCSFEKPTFSRSRCCRILLLFSRLEPLLFDTETAIIPPHIRDVFGPFQGIFASITGGQTQTTAKAAGFV